MDAFFLFLHSWLRWAIILLAMVVIAKSYIALRNKGSYEKQHAMLSLVLMILCDIMLLIGLFQWFTGPFGLNAISTMGFSEVMKNSMLRFFAVEHFVGMFIAIVIIHIARLMVKAKEDSYTKHVFTWRFTAVALVIILLAIPWPFLASGAGRGWF